MSFLKCLLISAGLLAGAASLPSVGQIVDESPAGADSVAQNRRVRFLVLPNAFYAPETRLGVGTAGQVLVRTDGAPRPSSLFAIVTVTQNRQVVLEVMPELYLDSARLFAKLTYNRWPDVFYGIGGNLSDAAAEDYSSNVFALHLEAQRRLGATFRVGLQFDTRFDRLFEREALGQLEKGEIPGSEKSRVAGPGLLLDFDTRDNIFAARNGHWFRLSAQFLHRIFGSQYDVGKYTADLRWFRNIGADHILAVQAYGSLSAGTSPFQVLPAMGGLRLMRGYLGTRNRDNHLMVIQGEYRSPFVWRLGLVAFGGLGDVAHNLGELRVRDARWNAGLGLRFRLNEEERLHLRVDYGFNLQDGSAKLYITVNEAI